MFVHPLTPTEQRFHDLLADGKLHTKKELAGCLSDDMGGESLVSFHLVGLRRKLKHRGLTVVCESHSKVRTYRLCPIPAPVSDE